MKTSGQKTQDQIVSHLTKTRKRICWYCTSKNRKFFKGVFAFLQSRRREKTIRTQMNINRLRSRNDNEKKKKKKKKSKGKRNEYRQIKEKKRTFFFFLFVFCGLTTT